jgi:hypothetical protein
MHLFVDHPLLPTILKPRVKHLRQEFHHRAGYLFFPFFFVSLLGSLFEIAFW